MEIPLRGLQSFGCRQKHDTINEAVARVWAKRGWRTRKNVEYRYGDVCGEVDIVATQGKYALFGETKSNHHDQAYSKALWQLGKAKKYKECIVCPSTRVFTFYAHSNREDDAVKTLWLPETEVYSRG